jgi:integrase/recombinase XerD
MKTYLDLHDVELMEKYADSARDKLLVRLLFRLGCRVSEVLNLKAADIDYEKATIAILHLKTRSRLMCPDCKASLARKHRFCPECGKEIGQIISSAREQKRIRILPIDEDTLSLLKEYVARNKLVFTDNTRHIFNINRHRAWQIVRDCAKRAGLPNLVNPETGRVRGASPHRLRDAFSVHAMKSDNSGDGLRLLQEHLGHASFNTTAKYRKIAGDEHRSWYDRLWHDLGKHHG